MKSKGSLLTTAAFVLTLANTADAFTALDNAADSVYNNGFQAGDNGGFGFGAWQVFGGGGSVTTNSSNGNGSNSGPGIDSSGRSLGIQLTGSSDIVARRSILQPLQIGQTFSADFDNGVISQGGLAMFQLVSGSSFSSFRLSSSGNYFLVDNTGTTNSTLTPTDGGLRLKWKVLSSSSYEFTALKLSDNSSWSIIRSSASTSFNDFYFNNFRGGIGAASELFANNFHVVPEPATLIALFIGSTSLIKARRRKS